MIAYAWIGILTTTTYVLAGFMREQVCTYMCPWPRIQAALTDEWALNVTYRYDRGEKRTSLKKANELRALGDARHDVAAATDAGHFIVPAKRLKISTAAVVTGELVDQLAKVHIDFGLKFLLFGH